MKNYICQPPGDYNKHWLVYFHNLTPEKREEIIIKIRDKYRKPEYISYWQSKGYYELPDDLLWMLLWYGEEYCPHTIENTYDLDFSTEAWIIDEKWIVKRHDFCESFVSVNTIKEDQELLKEYATKDQENAKS